MINYEKLFLEIADGFSPEEDILIKHQDIRDSAELNDFRAKLISKYKESGYRTEEEMLKILDEQQIWTAASENKLKQKNQELAGLKKSLPKITLPKEIRNLEKYIENVAKEVLSLELERKKHLGLTAEISADNVCWDYEICCSLYGRDKKRLITWDEYEDLDEDQVEKYKTIWFKNRERISVKNARNITVQPFFLNLFYIIEENNASAIFNRPVKDFTYYQSIVCNTALRVKRIRDNHPDIPDDVFEDAETLFKYVDGSKNKTDPKNRADATKILAKHGNKPVSLVKNQKAIS